MPRIVASFRAAVPHRHRPLEGNRLKFVILYYTILYNTILYYTITLYSLIKGYALNHRALNLMIKSISLFKAYWALWVVGA